jgi:eukaryotic-like serine/threonine-protein kinase
LVWKLDSGSSVVLLLDGSVPIKSEPDQTPSLMRATEPHHLDLFVGRKRELAQLDAAIDDALVGRGRLILLSGEPGIGKTRLADELAGDAVSRRMRVVWGRCWAGGGAPAYWPWVQVLRSLILYEACERECNSALPPEIAQLVPELSPEKVSPRVQSDPEAARFRLFDAVVTLLKQLARSVPSDSRRSA